MNRTFGATLNEFAKQKGLCGVPWLGLNKSAVQDLPQTMYHVYISLSTLEFISSNQTGSSQAGTMWLLLMQVLNVHITI